MEKEQNIKLEEKKENNIETEENEKENKEEISLEDKIKNLEDKLARTFAEMEN